MSTGSGAQPPPLYPHDPFMTGVIDCDDRFSVVMRRRTVPGPKFFALRDWLNPLGKACFSSLLHFQTSLALLEGRNNMEAHRPEWLRSNPVRGAERRDHVVVPAPAGHQFGQPLT